MVVEHLLNFRTDVCVTDNYEQTALHLASQNGHQEIMNILLEQNSHAVAQNKFGETALHLASLNGHADVVKQLTQGKYESIIDIQDNFSNTALILASENGHLSVVELLLSKCARTDVTDNEESGHTALYHAASNGHEEIAERILQATAADSPIKDIKEVFFQAAERGFDRVCKLCIYRTPNTDFDQEDKKGYTMLHYAAESGLTEMVGLLIGNGASVNAGADEDSTPLILAASAGRAQVVRILLAARADPRARIDQRTMVSYVASRASKTGGHADVVQALFEAGVDTDERDRDGRSALHHAAIHSNLKVAKVFLLNDADPNLQDLIGWTSLHHAARRGHEEIVRLLLDHGVDLYVPNYHGYIPVHVAAMSGHPRVMEILWKAAPGLLSYRTYHSKTPLHCAFGELQSAKWLLARSMDIDAVSNAGETTLMISAGDGKDIVVELLLFHNANVKLRDHSKQTALHHAAKSGYTEIAQKILEKDISIINDQDESGFSALHQAIRIGKSDLMKMLVEKRPHVDLDLKDNEGNTPLMLAAKKFQDDDIEHLLKCKADAKVRNNMGETALPLPLKTRFARKEKSTWMTLMRNSDCRNLNEGGGVFPSALHMTADNGELEMVQQLLEHGADINVQGGLYNTALQTAAAGGDEKVMVYLLRQGADASLGGGVFANALSAAVASGLSDSIPMLHARNADINAKDSQGRTAVHLAAWRGSLELFQWLQDKGGDLYVQDCQGRTVVHHAAMGGSLEVLKALMQDKKWESLNVEDIDGWRPLHWTCRSNGNKEMVELLNGVEENDTKKTKFGWTPENIAVFHDARELLPLLVPVIDETPTGDEVPDTFEGQYPQQPEQQLKKRSWKAGQIDFYLPCDGCQQDVSFRFKLLVAPWRF